MTMAPMATRDEGEAATAPEPRASPELVEWLGGATSAAGPYRLRSLTGGNSNDTLLVIAADQTMVMRRPPRAEIDPSAHNIRRELRMLEALSGTAVPAPAPIGLCEEEAVPEAPFLLMEAVDGVSLRDSIPDEAGDPGEAVRAIGEQVAGALAALHSLPWREIGLEDYGRPDGFLERQVDRWRKQLDRYRHRDLPDFDPVADWLEANRPPAGEPGILHGDFHVDNCLITVTGPPRLRAIIDWEMSTIGDPLLDLGLFLAFWGRDRSEPLGMPAIQGISRLEGAPTREEMASRYAEASGRSVEHLPYYMALAFWKLAAIVEGAHAHYVAGRLDVPYAAALEHDVPALLREARYFAGC